MDAVPRDSSFSNTMADLLAQAGVGPSSVIRIAGPGGLAPLLWLCRHGYDQVGYLPQGPCPADDCDLLMILHPGDAESLGHTLEKASHLKAGGVLVVQTPNPPADVVPDPLHLQLAASGYRVERCLHGAHREIHVARRQAVLKKAA
jgi:hypothetical protein